MPMASVDDPGEYLVPAGQDKQVKWLILLTADSKTDSVYDQFQTGGVPRVELEASEKGSLASDNDPTKDSNPSGEYLKVKSFNQICPTSNRRGTRLLG